MMGMNKEMIKGADLPIGAVGGISSGGMRFTSERVTSNANKDKKYTRNN